MDGIKRRRNFFRKEFLYSKWFLIAVSAATVLLFAISAVPFIVRTVTRQEFILTFPNRDGSEFYREVRLAPRFDSPRDRVEELVNQLIQGSVLLDPYPIFPYTTRVNQVAVTEDGILIDLSSEAAETRLPIESAMELVKKNISDNFSGYDSVTVTVNGNDPVVVNKLLEEKDSEH